MSDKKDMLREKSIDFTIAVSDICEDIKGFHIYVNQLLRCSSSIGANIYEARYAQSDADFISKLEIALKECYETEYWLRIFLKKEKLSFEQFKYLNGMRGEMQRMLIASITTVKNRMID